MNIDYTETRVQAVIFDFDGVICDTEPLHILSWQMLFLKKGLHIPDADLESGIGITDLNLLERLFQKYNVKAEPREWQLEKRSIFLDLLQQSVRDFPGSLDLIRFLRYNWPLAIASSAWRTAIETATRKLKIRNSFKIIVSKEDVATHKPSPEPFLNAALQLEVPPEQCAVIEDSVAGVQAAKSAGMLCIAVTNSYPAERLAAADLILDSLTDAPRIARFLTSGKS